MPTVQLDITSGNRFTPDSNEHPQSLLHNFTVGSDGAVYKLPMLKNILNTRQAGDHDTVNPKEEISPILSLKRFDTGILKTKVNFERYLYLTAFSWGCFNIDKAGELVDFADVQDGTIAEDQFQFENIIYKPDLQFEWRKITDDPTAGEDAGAYWAFKKELSSGFLKNGQYSLFKEFSWGRYPMLVSPSDLSWESELIYNSKVSENDPSILLKEVSFSTGGVHPKFAQFYSRNGQTRSDTGSGLPYAYYCPKNTQLNSFTEKFKGYQAKALAVENTSHSPSLIRKPIFFNFEAGFYPPAANVWEPDPGKLPVVSPEFFNVVFTSSVSFFPSKIRCMNKVLVVDPAGEDNHYLFYRLRSFYDYPYFSNGVANAQIDGKARLFNVELNEIPWSWGTWPANTENAPLTNDDNFTRSNMNANISFKRLREILQLSTGDVSNTTVCDFRDFSGGERGSVFDDYKYGRVIRPLNSYYSWIEQENPRTTPFSEEQRWKHFTRKVFNDNVVGMEKIGNRLFFVSTLYNALMCSESGRFDMVQGAVENVPSIAGHFGRGLETTVQAMREFNGNLMMFTDGGIERWVLSGKADLIARDPTFNPKFFLYSPNSFVVFEGTLFFLTNDFRVMKIASTFEVSEVSKKMPTLYFDFLSAKNVDDKSMLNMTGFNMLGYKFIAIGQALYNIDLDCWSTYSFDGYKNPVIPYSNEINHDVVFPSNEAKSSISNSFSDVVCTYSTFCKVLSYKDMAALSASEYSQKALAADTGKDKNNLQAGSYQWGAVGFILTQEYKDEKFFSLDGIQVSVRDHAMINDESTIWVNVFFEGKEFNSSSFDIEDKATWGKPLTYRKTGDNVGRFIVRMNVKCSRFRVLITTDAPRGIIVESVLANIAKPEGVQVVPSDNEN